ncbi:MAG: hypothetical protein ACREDR_08885 [Blastocatellia bacterium]
MIRGASAQRDLARTSLQIVSRVCALHVRDHSHYHKSPDLITDKELERYFLHLINVEKYNPSTVTVELAGAK